MPSQDVAQGRREGQVLRASGLGSASRALLWAHSTLAPPVLYHLQPLQEAHPSSGQPYRPTPGPTLS